MKPLAPYEIRDLNRELEERLKLRPLQTLAVVKSFHKGKCYGIGLSDPKKDLILRNLARLMYGLYRARPAAALSTSVTLNDITNTAKTAWTQLNTAIPGDATIRPFNCYAGGSELAFGNPASPPTPARDDYELASLVARFAPSSVVIDETNWRVTQTGSYVWTAGGTVREAGMSLYYYSSTTQTYYTFLVYHDAVSDVAVPAGGTVSVTYTTQF